MKTKCDRPTIMDKRRNREFRGIVTSSLQHPLLALVSVIRTCHPHPHSEQNSLYITAGYKDLLSCGNAQTSMFFSANSLTKVISTTFDKFSLVDEGKALAFKFKFPSVERMTKCVLRDPPTPTIHFGGE